MTTNRTLLDNRTSGRTMMTMTCSPSVNEAACYLWLFLIVCDYMMYIEEVPHFCGPNGRELSQISTNKKNK